MQGTLYKKIKGEEEHTNFESLLSLNLIAGIVIVNLLALRGDSFEYSWLGIIFLPGIVGAVKVILFALR